jgi:hypothetical protein
MFFITLAVRVLTYCIIGLPLVYLGFCIVTGRKKPYNFNGQNILDCLCFALNALYGTIPVLALANLQFPQTVMVPLTIAMAVLPFIVVVVVLCCSKPPFLEDDPTILPALDGDEAEARQAQIEEKKQERGSVERQLIMRQNRLKELKRRLERAKSREHKVGHGTVDLELQIGEIEDEITRIEANPLLAIGEDDWPYIFEQDNITVNVSSLSSILDCRIAEAAERKGESSPLLEEDREVSVNRRLLARKMEQMYQMLDLVLDGSTIETIVGAVNAAMWLGAIALGWFIGASMALDVPATYQDVPCA